MLQFILGLFISANVSLILYALILVGKRIYPNDTSYTINRTYPYSINGTEGMSQKGQYNNIIDNNINNYKIDRLFNYILDKENEIPKEFINKYSL